MTDSELSSNVTVAGFDENVMQYVTEAYKFFRTKDMDWNSIIQATTLSASAVVIEYVLSNEVEGETIDDCIDRFVVDFKNITKKIYEQNKADVLSKGEING
jgi:hypothetical protein